MKLNKYAIDVLNQVRPEWVLVRTNKQTLQAVQFFLDNVRQFKARVVENQNGEKRLFVKMDPLIRLGGPENGTTVNLHDHFDFRNR